MRIALRRREKLGVDSSQKGRPIMGARKKVSRPKSPVTLRDPHYSEFDTQKERNIQAAHEVNHK